MRKGILTDENGDLIISVKRDSEGKIISGLVVGNSDEQHIEHNILCNRGELKEYPYLGCEIRKQEKGELTEKFLKKMQISLESDGYSMKNVEFLLNK